MQRLSSRRPTEPRRCGNQVETLQELQEVLKSSRGVAGKQQSGSTWALFFSFFVSVCCPVVSARSSPLGWKC